MKVKVCENLMRHQLASTCVVDLSWQALAAAGSDAHPTDYLDFFCLIKSSQTAAGWDTRSVTQCIPAVLLVPLPTLRQDISVLHVVNINQRSLEGSRDTEVVAKHRTSYCVCL